MIYAFFWSCYIQSSFKSELRPRRYEQNKLNLALMQVQVKNNHKHSKTRMEQGNIKLHAKQSKFHIEHVQNGATVQHTLHTSFKHKLPKQQLGTLQSRKQHATGNIWPQT